VSTFLKCKVFKDHFGSSRSPNTSASNLSKSGELYVTPKRKSSRELLFEEPKRFRQQVIDSADPSGYYF
jgi:hypothetical protein